MQDCLTPNTTFIKGEGKKGTVIKFTITVGLVFIAYGLVAINRQVGRFKHMPLTNGKVDTGMKHVIVNIPLLHLSVALTSSPFQSSREFLTRTP